MLRRCIGKVGLILSSMGTTTGTRGFFSGILGVLSFKIWGVCLKAISGAFGTLGLCCGVIKSSFLSLDLLFFESYRDF